MAKSTTGINKDSYSLGTPKRTRQGAGKGTKSAATSRNNAKKAYRGQGRG